MPIWDELVKLSVLGTEHQSATPLVASGPLAMVVQQIQGDEKRSAASKILCAAAATELYQRVGKTLNRATADTLMQQVSGIGETQDLSVGSTSDGTVIHGAAGIGETVDRAMGSTSGGTVIHGAAGIGETQDRAVGAVAPGIGQTGTQVCQEDTFVLCGDRSSSHLNSLIAEGNEDLLKEWLNAAKQAGKRPPHFFLPLLLQLGASKPALRPTIIDCVGQRARWLAIQNDNWRYVLVLKTDQEVTDFASLWETGELHERVSALKAVRQSDPDKAREMLISSWKQDPPDQRALFLAELRTNLTIQDEPFIEETALNDRRKEVRATAVDLLASMGDSRLTKRMIERVSNRLTVQQLRPGKQAIELALPEACDKAMERDGIALTRTASGVVGQRADWLIQMIGKLNPVYWCERFNQSAAGIIEMILNSDGVDRTILFAGFHDAIARHKNIDWVAPMVNAKIGIDISDLFEFLDQPSRDALIVWYVTQLRTPQSQSSAAEFGIVIQYLVTLMRQCDSGSLSEQASRLTLEFCKRECAGNREYYNPITAILPVLAVKLPSSLMPDALTGWKIDKLAPPVERVVDRFVETVTFRHEMHEALTQ